MMGSFEQYGGEKREQHLTETVKIMKMFPRKNEQIVHTTVLRRTVSGGKGQEEILPINCNIQHLMKTLIQRNIQAFICPKMFITIYS